MRDSEGRPRPAEGRARAAARWSLTSAKRCGRSAIPEAGDGGRTSTRRLRRSKGDLKWNHWLAKPVTAAHGCRAETRAPPHPVAPPAPAARLMHALPCSLPVPRLRVLSARTLDAAVGCVPLHTDRTFGTLDNEPKHVYVL
ncbi:hypothetical protein EVAR_57716_1 [Eumeta japonica]|uniref:Uncharacterized protein n=1 Tax=Eumeta variegata TaxID=151549 RepID=A0A4C1Y8Z7_EUMVA|nr:hypothetical protein EVAR_57716_1 [Eumeta japonica]